jgi:hypothetical protein
MQALADNLQKNALPDRVVEQGIFRQVKCASKNISRFTV